MHIPLRPCLEIGKERIGALHRGVQVVVERLVVHQQAQRTLVAVELGRHLLHIAQSLVDLGHGADSAGDQRTHSDA